MNYIKVLFAVYIVCIASLLYGSESEKEKKILINNGKDWQKILLMREQFYQNQNNNNHSINLTRGNRLHHQHIHQDEKQKM